MSWLRSRRCTRGARRWPWPRSSRFRGPRTAARLLVSEEGELIGNISGGCLENDVADVARIVMDEGLARVVSFDLTADDEAVWLEPGLQRRHRAVRRAGG
jgi:hypothetical protein